MKKNYKVILLALAVMVLAACGRGPVSSQSPELWDQFVYGFARVISFLSIGGNTGVGIVLFTLLIRTLLLPVFQYQMNSSRKMQELQPQLKALQAKYPGKDMESRTKLNDEMQALYKEKGVNPFTSMLPLLIQMPVFLALYQALTRVDFLKQGHFLWLNLAESDPYYILPILAAAFTFLSMWLSNKALPEKNGMMTGMAYAMPVMVFFFSLNVPSGAALYWAVSYLYQVGQTLILSNPFKIVAQREAEEAAAKEIESKKKRAMKKARKKKK